MSQEKQKHLLALCDLHVLLLVPKCQDCMLPFPSDLASIPSF